MIKLFGLVSVLGLIACGQAAEEATVEPKEVVKEDPAKEPSTTTKGVVPAYSVTSASDLPACESAINGQLIFTESDGKFQYCRDSVWTVIQEEEEPEVAPVQLVNKQYQLSVEEFCLATGLEVYAQYCYLQRGEIITFADGTAFYSLIVYQSKLFNDGDTDSDSRTVSGFTKVVDNKIAINMGLFMGLVSEDFVTHWMSVTLGVSAFILEDSNDSGEVENTDTVAASFEVVETEL